MRNALEADFRGAKEELAKARIAARTAEATAASTKTRLQLVEIELSELKQDQVWFLIHSMRLLATARVPCPTSYVLTRILVSLFHCPHKRSRVG